MITPLMRRSLGVLLAILPPLTLVAPLAAAPLLGLMAIAGLLPWLWLNRRTASVGAIVRDPVLWLTAGLLLWGGATLLWSAAPGQGAALLPRVGLTLVAGIVFAHMAVTADEATQTVLRRGLLIGLGLAVAWLVIDIHILDFRMTAALTGHHADPENVPKRGLTLLAILTWPAALAVARSQWRCQWGWGWGWPAAVAATVLLATLVLLSDAGAAKLALVISAAVLVAGLLAPRLTAAVGAAVVAIGILSAPWTVPATIESLDLVARTEASTQHRMVIWTFTAEHVRERPWSGWGFNMARSIPGGQDIEPLTGGEFIPLHPHNAPLQWWLEMGLPGALIGVVLVILLSRRAACMPADRAGRATALASLSAAITVSALAYGAWQLWWLSVLAIVAGVVALVAIPVPTASAETSPSPEEGR